MDCGKDMLCDACPRLRPAQLASEASVTHARPPIGADHLSAGAAEAASPLRVLVGIGNPGEKYRDTPHNVGFTVLDILAGRHGLTWENSEEVQIARLTRPEGDILLVKPQKYVNNTGKALLGLSKSLRFTGDHCVLVHDDIH